MSKDPDRPKKGVSQACVFWPACKPLRNSTMHRHKNWTVQDNSKNHGLINGLETGELFFPLYNSSRALLWNQTDCKFCILYTLSYQAAVFVKRTVCAQHPANPLSPFHFSDVSSQCSENNHLDKQDTFNSSTRKNLLPLHSGESSKNTQFHYTVEYSTVF